MYNLNKFQIMKKLLMKILFIAFKHILELNSGTHDLQKTLQICQENRKNFEV